MEDKKSARIRRAGKTRYRIAQQVATRLLVHRSNSHIYAQIIDPSGGRVLVSASTLEKEVRATQPHGNTVSAAEVVGKRIAEKARQAGVSAVAFDRSGFKYHGRIKALAEAARSAGLQF